MEDVGARSGHGLRLHGVEEAELDVALDRPVGQHVQLGQRHVLETRAHRPGARRRVVEAVHGLERHPHLVGRPRRALLTAKNQTNKRATTSALQKTIFRFGTSAPN